MPNPANILIVDDNETNRNTLKYLVIELGHNPILAENGLSALTQIKKEAPDLILLDVLMPEMDGTEVLENLKKDKNLRHIPVIMISALDQMEDVVRCIEKGAEDYLAKPFNPTLLTARIGACLDKKQFHDKEKEYQNQIEEYNLQLEDKVRQKTKELAEAHVRLKILDKAKSDFLQLISHELRTPLNGLLGAGEILGDDDSDEETREEFRGVFERSSDRMLNIIDQALLLAQIETSGDKFPLEPNPVREILDSAVKMAADFAESRNVRIGQISDCDGLVRSDNEYLTKAFTSLIRTAVKFSNEGNEVALSCEPQEDEILIDIRASGRVIPPEAVPKFFEVFSIADPITPGGDLGLDPPVAERIIKLFGGSVAVENLGSAGVAFKVKLRRVQEILEKE